MRFEFDKDGYVCCILYGCYTGNCTAYTGLVPNEPEEYEDMDDWADRAKTQAYYLDSNGNLTYDARRAAKLCPEDEVVIDGEEPVSGFDIDISDFYTKLREKKNAQTSAANLDSFLNTFEKYLAGNDWCFTGMFPFFTSNYRSCPDACLIVLYYFSAYRWKIRYYCRYYCGGFCISYRSSGFKTQERLSCNCNSWY